MDTDTFEYLLENITPLIEKKTTHLRECIPPAERLSVTLRHLATGESQESLSLQFRIAQSTISKIIREVCAALIYVLKNTFLRMPTSAEEWSVVAEDFGRKWNFYNCIGAIDGKHIRIDPPVSSGSAYYNYKDFYSIVLLAVVDAQLRFIYIDLGTNGRMSDSSIWNKCSLKSHLRSNNLPLPQPSSLPESDINFPHVLVGDEIFPLTTKLLIPYPVDQCCNRVDRKIFNYRLSRARRCSENAFGVLGARFQIFRTTMRYDPEEAIRITMACCCLHNMLRSQCTGRAMYTPSDFLDEEDILTGLIRTGEWRQQVASGLAPMSYQGGNRHANDARILRDMWTTYFNGPGAVCRGKKEWYLVKMYADKTLYNF
ncbi:putative nuclease HARBI1 isoform X2 [Odontomachus brunneus]|nr:putative nuclease HARBI1 isoform X2 [Odontomachus brunneus]XP_032678520.1 putative nuclease HARBI1 isoform X2 [Odontomachus brunneus]